MRLGLELDPFPAARSLQGRSTAKNDLQAAALNPAIDDGSCGGNRIILKVNLTSNRTSRLLPGADLIDCFGGSGGQSLFSAWLQSLSHLFALSVRHNNSATFQLISPSRLRIRGPH